MLNSPRLVYLIALLCLNSSWSRSLIAQPTKPNILIIVGDDMGYADVGFHGCKDIPTPNLDALAAGGARFTNGYVSGPYCSPTRAGLLTGRYQQRFGHEFNPAGDDAGLPVGESTLADRLKAVGYQTALVGKWHLGSKPNMHPQKRGFDEFFGFLGGAHSYFETKGSSATALELRNWTIRRMHLVERLFRSSIEIRTNPGFFILRSTPFIHQWTRRQNTWIDLSTSKTRNAVLTAQ